MSTKKRIAIALERIAVALETNNDLANECLILNKINTDNNEGHLKNNKNATTMQTVALLSNISPILKERTTDFIEAVQRGDLKTAYEIQNQSNESKPKTTRGRKSKVINE